VVEKINHNVGQVLLRQTCQLSKTGDGDHLIAAITVSVDLSE
jgi:hypothetical protein